MDGISLLFLYLDYVLSKLPISKEVSEQYRMGERKAESLYDSQSNQMILIKCFSNTNSTYDTVEKVEFRDVVFIMFNPFKNKNIWASLVAQWLRICLPMQGTRVRALVWEDPTCRGATRPVSHNC